MGDGERGGVLSLGLRVIKIGGGQRKYYFQVTWYIPRVHLNKLYAVFELVRGACYWEEVGGFLVMLNV